MKIRIMGIIVLALALIATGCQSTGPRTKTGAVAGGLLGAAAGGIVGHQSGHGLEGAAIGAGVGALGGALVGSAMDQNARKIDAEAKQANPQYLALTSIVDMAKKGLPDDAIIGEIQRTGSTYTMTSEVISYLKQNGVSDRVVNYMMSASR